MFSPTSNASQYVAEEADAQSDNEDGSYSEDNKQYYNKCDKSVVCKLFLSSRCRWGIRGVNCPYKHLPVCKKLLQNGTRDPYGCNKGQECSMFHPKMCADSLKFRACTLYQCQLVHVKGTRRSTVRSKENIPNISPHIIQHIPARGKSKASQLPPHPTDKFTTHQFPGLGTTPSSSISIDNLILYNVNGLYPKSNQAKVPFLNELSKEVKPPLMCCVETKLDAEVMDSEIKIENYNISRTDRKNRSGGGVAIYHEEVLNCTTLLSLSNTVCEVLIIEVHNNDTVVCLIYRPPDCVYEEFKDILKETMKILDDHRNSDIILLGDLNFPEIKWSDQEPRSVHSSGDKRLQIEALLNLTDDLFLNQLITKPTRGDNTLDLLFTNITDSLYDFTSSKSSNFSDHNLLELKLTAPHPTYSPADSSSKIVKNKLNYHKADFNKIKLDLKDIGWKDILEGKSVSEQLDSILETVNEVSQKYTPKYKIQTSYRSKFYKDRRALMRKRRRVVTALNKCKNQQHISNLDNKLMKIESEIKASHIAERDHEENEAIKKISSNTKYFYAYARRKQKTKENIGPFLDKSTSEIISDEKQIADRLQAQYCSVFSKPDPKYKIHDMKSFFQVPENINLPHISDFDFTTNDIEGAIKELKANSAPGLDGFSALMLKKCAEELSEPLYTLFRHSIDTGEIPSLLKDAVIIPIHKGGIKSQPQNYRPINLISHILKVLEKIIRTHLVFYLELNQHMNPNQHGFRQQRSCLSQLLDHFDQVIEAVYNNENCDVMYLDFSKAFDVVDHQILMTKLKNLGITGKIGYWIHSFLANRKQTVSVNGTKSETCDVTSGVPQGSVLGPVLFIIMISDIDKDTRYAVTSVFADDTKLKFIIRSLEDCELLQSDLNTVYSWSDANNMKFNSLKFQSIRYGNKKELNHYPYKDPSGKCIPIDEYVKDLGIMMSRDLTFTKQIDAATARCRGLTGWILRTFKSRNKDLMLTLLKSLIIPRLDYCSQLYSPSLMKDWCKLEGVQRTFTSRISEVKHLDYWSRLQELKLYSVQRRHERYAIIYTWKIIQNLAPNLSKNPVTTHHSTRRGVYCNVPRVRNTGCSAKTVNIRENSFAIKGPRLFNSMPQKIRNLSSISVDKFKRELDKVLSTIPDMPTVPGYAGRRSACSNSLVDISSAGDNSSTFHSGGRSR